MRHVCMLAAMLVLIIGSAGAVRSAEIVRLVAGEGFYPQMFLERGQPRGYAIDIARAVLEEAGYDVHVEVLPWARAQIEMLKHGAVITGVSKTQDRIDAGFLFTDIVFSDPTVLIAKAGTTMGFETAGDLHGLVVGIQRGASYGPVFEAARPHMIIEEDDSKEQRLRKIVAGRIDLGVFSGTGPAYLLFASQSLGLSREEFKIFEKPLEFDLLHMAVSRDSPRADGMIEKLNSAIVKLTLDGTIERLHRAYGHGF
ncbi:amino acid ABC transporter substrate-binding protein [Roseibium aquae]|uniref:Amino acid ABC transporter substrate-binding protein n=1 Tax=Roseibium aquae TaxID=1323746 RepID=A0A916TI01_9HYPH|nr:transporter substrate-binding domain-containing protein [Roseibium aquae]GGB46159.1 amino acid ABC transporter substrate-binding protein [Roseibium aquae]